MRRATDVPVVVGVVAAILGVAAGGAEAAERWRRSLTPFMWATDVSEALLDHGKANVLDVEKTPSGFILGVRIGF